MPAKPPEETQPGGDLASLPRPHEMIERLARDLDALRTRNAELTRMADDAPVLFWMQSARGIDFANRSCEEFVGRRREALRGTAWAELVHPDDRAAYVAAFDDALARGGHFVSVCRLRRKDGEYRWVKSVGTPRFDDDGKPFGFIGTSLDVTDLKDAERAKNEFLGVLSHELRNPLAAISSAAAFLARPDQRPADVGKVVAVIERQAATMTRLVDDLLEVSRITHGKIHLRRQPLDLLCAVRAAAEDAAPLLAEARQELQMSLPAAPVWIDADPLRVEQIFGNLLRNASKFTREGGHVGISVAAGGGFASVSVRDDGIGIERKELTQIFDLFAQGARGAPHAQGGVGIGLSIARTLAEMHGGTVEARSAGPGEGSEFIVRLPLRAQSAQPPQRAQPRPADPSSRARRVLLVEDHPDVASAMKAYLAGVGHTVRIVGDGLSVQEAAREYRPEVVLLDIGLPDLTGYEVARRLRGDPETRGIRLVALTGFGRDDDMQRARDAGFDAHVAKPASPEALDRAMDPATGWE
ncbi:MAG TPA: ATP-binding protein [Usitatibacter sp.]|nr:ATP-binding protein [Usitatibacter sp.]